VAGYSFYLSAIREVRVSTVRKTGITSTVKGKGKGKGFSATSLEWLLEFQEVKAPGSSRLSAL
jgi:hypothetical protein